MESKPIITNNGGDSVHIQPPLFDGEQVTLSIWKTGGHASTYLTQSQLKELIQKLTKFVEADHV